MGGIGPEETKKSLINWIHVTVLLLDKLRLAWSNSKNENIC